MAAAESSKTTVPYRVSTPDASRRASRALTYQDRINLAVLFVVGAAVRFYKLHQPSSVVFDEVHFGGFARKYIIGRFFMDVHPPLAKMLYAVVGYLSGYDGEFDFKTIGVEYAEHNVPYVAMRTLPATLGLMTILLAYATLRASGCRSWIAMFGGLLVTIDNGLTTQSRFILLDSPLLFFIAITVYAFKRFENEAPFSRDWFRYLFLTGLGLGATVSSKWVGLFTIGWVGLLTLYQLWWILGDLHITPLNFSKQFLYRAIFLIAVPATFYAGMFALHFVCLVNDGDGASFMSPEFQSTLQHTKLNVQSPVDVAFGSEVILRHWNTQGGYLHSHDHMYETGSKQQQVTLYPHKDENNIWVIENMTVPDSEDEEGNPLPKPEPIDYSTHSPPVLIEDGMVIRLRHKPSERRLHSHDIRPPVSEQDHQNEVSAYGYEGFEGDINDNFRVEIVESYSEPDPSGSKRVRTLHTKFRLIHTTTGCALFSHAVKLPKWAFEQQEVTCINQGTLPNSIWFIEENYHPMLGDDAEKVSYRQPGFVSKFLELNKVMWRVNAGLTETHNWESRPESWPLMLRGINFWVKDNRQIYLIGNGVTWWTITGLIGLYAIWKVIWLLRWQRGFTDFANDLAYGVFDSGFGSYLVGWACHYFPSYLMERQLFLHHYLASAYFGILGLAQFWEFFTFRILRNNKLLSGLTTALFFSASLGWFVWYSPLIYGDAWTSDLCKRSTFLDMDFDCNAFNTPVPLSTSFEDVLKLDQEYRQKVEDGNKEAKTEVVEEEEEEAVPVDNGIIQETVGEPDIANKAKGQESETPAQDSNDKVDYRDQDGNPIDPEEVERLVREGKIELQTVHV